MSGQPAPSHIRVLLIEDNAGDALLIRELLRDAHNADFHFVHETHLARGLEQLSRHPFDVLLLDLGLPDSKGVETLTRAQRSAQGLPIILLTGLEDDATAMEALSLGAQDYVAKSDVSTTLLARSIRYAIQRHQLEEKERERQQYLHAQERLATVGQLAAGIAHDFNNIMSVITLYSQMLQQNPTSPDNAQYLDTIYQQAKHATHLIHQILDFSRRSVMARHPVDLLPFLKEFGKLLQRTFPESIEIELDQGLGHYVTNIDPQRLQEALMNLCLNARDAMPDGGRLAFELDHIYVHAEEPPPLPDMVEGRWLTLAVTDTGSGIDAEHLPHIFEPFYTTKQPDKGTGLGLAQVYGIVKQLDGEISVSSRPGMGSRFTLYLPALEVAVHPAPESPSEIPTGRGRETVLLVEDNAMARVALQDLLTMLGYTVLVAGNGRAALETFQQHMEQIDLVLSDMVMPVMGGLDLFHELRRLHPDLKMLMVTGYPLEDDGKAMLEQGVFDWLPKPYTAEQVARKVRNALDEPVNSRA